MSDVVISEAPLEDALRVHEAIEEFAESPKQTREDFESRYKGKEHVIFVASVDDQLAGYLIAYDRDTDGSFYCWMAGVRLEYRRQGVLGALIEGLEEWARGHGYDRLTIKTRNNRREMITFLVKDGFFFTQVEEHEEMESNRIHLVKQL